MRNVLSLSCLMILGCAGPTGGESPSPVGTIDNEPIDRSAFVEAFLAEQGDAFFVRYVDRLLVERAAEKAKVVVEPGAVRTAVDRESDRAIKGSFGGQKEAFEAKLAQYGLTYEQWRKNRSATERHQLLAEGILKSSPGEVQVKALFERRFGKGGVRHRISHILVSTNPKTSRFYPATEYAAEKGALEAWARKKLTELKGQLARGAKFANLAKTHSEDGTAAAGGDLNADWTGLYGRPFETAIQATPIGGVTEIVASKKGLHLMKVTGLRKGARYRGRLIFASTVAQNVGSPKERRAAALAKIAKARAEILGGKTFEDVAKAMSDDPVTRPRGGELGEFAPGRLGPEADAVLERLPLKKLSPPIRAKTGYLLVFLDEREFRPARDKKTVSHIYLATDFMGVKKRKLAGRIDPLAKAKAEDVLAKLRGGASFAQLAKAHSDDELTRMSGGAIPTYRPNLFGPGVDEVLAKLESGKMGVAKTKRGYHVVRLDGIARSDFATVRSDLVRELSQKKITKEQVDNLVKTLRAASKIEKTLSQPRASTP